MRRYSKWSSRAKVIGGVSALTLVITSGAFAWVGTAPSTVTVKTDGGGSVYAASDIALDNGTELSPGSTIPIVIRVHNDSSSTVSLASLAAGSSTELGEVEEGVASAEYCPAGSIKTTAVNPAPGDATLTSIEGFTDIPSGGQATYSSFATFDVGSFPDLTDPADDQTGCLGTSHEVPVAVTLAP